MSNCPLRYFTMSAMVWVEMSSGDHSRRTYTVSDFALYWNQQHAGFLNPKSQPRYTGPLISPGIFRTYTLSPFCSESFMGFPSHWLGQLLSTLMSIHSLHT